MQKEFIQFIQGALTVKNSPNEHLEVKSSSGVEDDPYHSLSEYLLQE